VGENTKRSLQDERAGKPVVLMVDGVAHFHGYMHHLLTYNDLDVDFMTAMSIEQAKLRIDEQTPDLILMEYWLPDGCGCDIIDYAESKGLSVKYALVTAFSEEQLASKGIRERFVRGAHSMIRKQELCVLYGAYVASLLPGGGKATNE